MTTSQLDSAIPISGAISQYPRAIVTNDGTLLVTYKYTHDKTERLVTRGSKDQGATWSDTVDVISCGITEAALNNPFLFQSSSGELLCTYGRFALENGKPSHLSLDVSQSTDGGQSWAKIGTILSEAPRHDVVKGEWEPFLHEAPDGTLQVYYSHEIDLPSQHLVKRTSSDGGKTWSDYVTVAGSDTSNQRPGMAQVLSLDASGKNVMMAYENNVGGRFRVWAQTSSDGGNTWVNPHIIFDPGHGDAGGPGLVQVSDHLAVSFMTNQDHPKQSYSDLKYVDLKVITSGDGGATWSSPKTIIPQAGWGGMTVDKGEVMVLGQTATNAVVMKKFNP